MVCKDFTFEVCQFFSKAKSSIVFSVRNEVTISESSLLRSFWFYQDASARAFSRANSFKIFLLIAVLHLKNMNTTNRLTFQATPKRIILIQTLELYRQFTQTSTSIINLLVCHVRLSFTLSINLFS